MGIPVLLVLGFTALFFLYDAQRASIHKTLFSTSTADLSQRLETRFAEFFSSVTSVLEVAQEWGRMQSFDLGDPARLNRRFIPILERSPQIAGVIIANDAGRQYFLKRTPGDWLTSLTNAEQTPREALIQHWSDAATPEGDPERKPTDYDPRTRPWFTGAVNAGAPPKPYWTAPYTFATEGSPIGITASMMWQERVGESVRDWVIALDVLLDDIVAWTQTISGEKDGTVFVLSDEGRLLRPAAPSPDTIDAERMVLMLADDADESEVSRAFSAWRDLGNPAKEPFAFDVADVPHWAEARRLALGDRGFWVFIVLSEDALFDRLGIAQSSVPAIIFAFGLLVCALSAWLVWRHTRAVPVNAMSGVLSDDKDEAEANLAALVHGGESDTVEFKETIRHNIRAGRHGKEMEIAWLKTVVGFLNAEGGTIVIGVDDRGQAVGIEADGFSNEDALLRHVDNLICEHVGGECSRLINARLLTFEEKTVLAIACAPSPTPAFLQTKSEEAFFVRSGPASRKLSPSQILKYLEARGANERNQP